MPFGFGFGLPHRLTSGGGKKGLYISFVYTGADYGNTYPSRGSTLLVNADKTVTIFGIYDNGSGYLGLSIPKLTSTGAYSSSQVLSPPSNLFTNGVDVQGPSTYAVDSSGNIYVTAYVGNNGATTGALVIFKFNSSGVYQTSVSLNTLNTSRFYPNYQTQISIDSSNNLKVISPFLVTTTGKLPMVTLSAALAPTTWEYTTTYTGGPSGAFISPNIKSTAGVVIAYTIDGVGYIHSRTNGWTKSITAIDPVYYDNNSIDAINTDSSGNTYVLYRLGSTNNGGGYINLLKFDSTGALQWQTMWTIGYEYQAGAANIIFDSSNNIYAIYNDYDYSVTYPIIYKVSPSAGVVQWARDMYETTESWSPFVQGATYSSSDPNYIYLTGGFYRTAVGNTIFTTRLPTNGKFTGAYGIGAFGVMRVYNIFAGQIAGSSVVATVTNPTFTTSTGTSSTPTYTSGAGSYNSILVTA